MNLKQFKYVLTLNNEGCFSKAADVLNISQPSLSQYIKKIEKELGVILFDRSGSNVRLTDAGKVYIEAGKKILDIKREMSLRFMDIAENKIGTITIGTSPYRSSVMMPRIAKEFKKLYPGITLVIEEGNTDELMEGTLRGEYDLSLTVFEQQILNFDLEKITEEEFILAVPSSFEKLEGESLPNRKYKAIDISQLGGIDFVMIKDSLFMQRTLNTLGEKYKLDFNTSIVANSLEAQFAMVRAGLGVALVPSGIEMLCASGEVDFYSFKQELPKREIVAVWRKDKELSETEQALLSLIKGLDW